ncbi:MAG: NTF2-like N-terminal transpeptidase domain-containing protein, partial [Anaerolineales bacterium]|nr:NTF2-like N-terminal transpeptidase domain-containing protein [Anaerolineales bacterium]
MIKRLVPLLASAWMMVMAGCAPLADFPLLTLSPPPITPLPTLTPTTPPHIPDPNPVARTYLDAWQAEDYPAMYAWLTPLSQDAITLERFAAIHRNSAATMSLKTIGHEILSSLVKSQTAQIGYRITFDTILIGQVERDTIMALSLIGDQWRVQWDHAMIMPELAGGNTLWMEYRVPARGNIYDARGHALVAQTDAVSLGLIVGETDQQQEADLYHELWQLTGITPEAIRARVESYREGWYLPLAEVSAAQVEARLPALEGMTGLVMEPYRARYYFEGG